MTSSRSLSIFDCMNRKLFVDFVGRPLGSKPSNTEPYALLSLRVEGLSVAAKAQAMQSSRSRSRPPNAPSPRQLLGTRGSRPAHGSSCGPTHFLVGTMAAAILFLMWIGGSSGWGSPWTRAAFSAPNASLQPSRVADSNAGGWDPVDVQHVDTEQCNIPRIHAADLSREAFADRYLEKQPVIVVGLSSNDRLFAAHVRKEVLVAQHGNATVTLSSANRNSYAKLDVPLRTYLSPTYLRPQPLNASGAETWYLFGDHHTDAWRDVFRHYDMPTKYTFGQYSTLSFGIGPAGSGVPFHTHGHVFNEVVYGKKRWWLQAPGPSDDDGPRFDPDASSLQWLDAVRPTYTDAEAAALWECVCRPGELLYIPSMWHHATLNIGETVFMAVFV